MEGGTEGVDGLHTDNHNMGQEYCNRQSFKALAYVAYEHPKCSHCGLYLFTILGETTSNVGDYHDVTGILETSS